jgi:hypothetical protein
VTAQVIHLRDAQLTIDGREIVLLPDGRLPGMMHLGPRQREVMRHLGLRSSIRAVQAGVIIHSQRGHCGHGVRDEMKRSAYRGEGCCRYASTDGSQLLKALEKAQLVENVGGIYYRIHDA